MCHWNLLVYFLFHCEKKKNDVFMPLLVPSVLLYTCFIRRYQQSPLNFDEPERSWTASFMILNCVVWVYVLLVVCLCMFIICFFCKRYASKMTTGFWKMLDNMNVWNLCGQMNKKQMNIVFEKLFWIFKFSQYFERFWENLNIQNTFSNIREFKHKHAKTVHWIQSKYRI